jgi:hypothetical protein
VTRASLGETAYRSTAITFAIRTMFQGYRGSGRPRRVWSSKTNRPVFSATFARMPLARRLIQASFPRRSPATNTLHFARSSSMRERVDRSLLFSSGLESISASMATSSPRSENLRATS